MTIALIILGVLLAVAAAVSALGKLRRLPSVVATMHGVGVSDRGMVVLAIAELAGALGLAVGIWLSVLGVLAAAGLTLYFLGAVIAHLRVKAPAKDVAPAGIILVLAVAVLVLEFLR